MANLALLYALEIVSDLPYKAAHLVANFSQLIARSNEQDASIAELEAGVSAGEARLTSLEATAATAAEDITALQAALEGRADKATSSPYIVDLDQYSVISIDESLLNPTVRVPYAGDRDPGLTVEVYGHPSGGGSWNLEVWNSSSGATDYYTMRAGYAARLTLVERPDSSLSTWEFTGDRAGIIESRDLFTTTVDVSANYVTTRNIVAENSTTSAIIVTMPPISELGAYIATLTLNAISTGDVTVKAHASDGGATIATVTASGSKARYIISCDPYNNTWAKVQIS